MSYHIIWYDLTKTKGILSNSSHSNEISCQNSNQSVISIMPIPYIFLISIVAQCVFMEALYLLTVKSKCIFFGLQILRSNYEIVVSERLGGLLG